MRNIIKQFIPKPIGSIMRRVYYFPTDTIDLLLGRRDNLTPPRGMIFVGDGDFKKIGEEFLQYFIEFGEIKLNERVRLVLNNLYQRPQEGGIF